MRWLAALPVVLALVVGCAQAQESRGTAEPIAAAPTTTAPLEDFEAQASDFVHVKDMTAIREFFISNPKGHLAEALAVANAPEGGVYPVGTIIQLVPQEAMVKRRAGFDPKSNDWEFFELGVSAEGTKINKRGGAEVVSSISKSSCADCHKFAQAKFDFVCENDHGCEPLPIPDSVFLALQQGDPRPQKAV